MEARESVGFGAGREMTPGHWSREESRQALAAGLAPLVVACLVAAVGGLWMGGESWRMLIVLVPMSYATLLFFVLPALWLVRRFGKESSTAFALASGLGVLVPWLALYWLIFPIGTGKYSGAIGQVAMLLILPALLAAVAGLVVHRAGRTRRRPA